MGESEAAAQAAAGPESAEATSPRPAIDAPGGDLVASAAALARLAARPIDASAAPPRVPGPTLSRHALALQRTAGNAATRRLLLRQPPGTLERPSYRLVPPSGTAWEIARWTRERVNAAEGRDIIAVLTASQILMFSAAASPKLIDTAPRSANEDDIKINSGVWRWNDPKMTPDFLETTKDLTIDGWAFAPYGQGGPENLAADAGKAKVKAMIPQPARALLPRLPARRRRQGGGDQGGARRAGRRGHRVGDRAVQRGAAGDR
jgi:hypothetical protein